MDETRRIVRDGYNTVAERYVDGRDEFYIRDMLEMFYGSLAPGGHVLDVGCGSGVPVARFLTRSGFSVTGIDLSDAMLALATGQVPEATFLAVDMTEMPFPAQSFDGVIAC